MTSWSDFDLIEEIGRGAFGTVYRANHPTLRQQVALKLVSVSSGRARDIEKALDEPRRLASVRHQNVVVVHDARYLDGYVGICMELIHGESLFQLVDRHGTLGPDEATTCASHLCRALAAIHRANLIHNDVKAQNVMREAGGRIVLMDFGAGRQLLDPEETTGMHLAGTPAYMAPELFQMREPTAASDVYSLGVLLFYVLCGRYPVTGRSLQEFARAHAGGHRIHLGDLRADVPARLLRIVGRALEPDPSIRYATPGGMLRDITERRAVVARPRPREVPPPSEPAGPLPQATPGSPLPSVQRRSQSVGSDRGRIAAASVAGAVAFIWMLGYLASKEYAMMFGLTGSFASESPLTWFSVGVSALVLPAFYMLATSALWLVATFAWDVLGRVSPTVNRWSEETSRSLAGLGTRAGLTDAKTLAMAVLVLQVVLLAAVNYRFQRLILAFATPIADNVIAAHSLLSRADDSEWLLFRGVLSVLAITAGAAWWQVGRRRRAGDGALAPLTAGIALTAVMILLSSVAWRIVQQSSFEVAMVDTERCFVIAERNGQAFLYCPSRRRTLTVSLADPSLKRLAYLEDIFAAVVPAAHTRRSP